MLVFFTGREVSLGRGDWYAQVYWIFLGAQVQGINFTIQRRLDLDMIMVYFGHGPELQIFQKILCEAGFIFFHSESDVQYTFESGVHDDVMHLLR